VQKIARAGGHQWSPDGASGITKKLGKADPSTALGMTSLGESLSGQDFPVVESGEGFSAGPALRVQHIGRATYWVFNNRIG
jgi:hypothetical protein